MFLRFAHVPADMSSACCPNPALETTFLGTWSHMPFYERKSCISGCDGFNLFQEFTYVCPNFCTSRIWKMFRRRLLLMPPKATPIWARGTKWRRGSRMLRVKPGKPRRSCKRTASFSWDTSKHWVEPASTLKRYQCFDRGGGGFSSSAYVRKENWQVSVNQVLINRQKFAKL